MSCTDCPPLPQTAYSIAKKAAQQLANSTGKTYYIDVDNNYGEYTGNTAYVKEIIMPEGTVK